jgi:hypothetical protein
VNPPRELWGTSRSVPFYAPCQRHAIELLNCIDTENPKQFEDITAGDYLYERLVDLGLKKIIRKFTLVIKDIEFT